MLEKLFPYRFQIFFFSQITFLFGSLIVPSFVFEDILSPILLIINLTAGLLFFYGDKKRIWIFTLLLILAVGLSISTTVQNQNSIAINTIQMATFFVFHVAVAFQIIRQVWRSSVVDKSIIFGLISGYISLGLIGFFIGLSIEMAYPGSFSGLYINGAGTEILTERMIYYSYITLLTIGYGDILPVTLLAQKAAILIGLMGQFYLVIITAVVLEKYIRHRNNPTS